MAFENWLEPSDILGYLDLFFTVDYFIFSGVLFLLFICLAPTPPQVLYKKFLFFIKLCNETSIFPIGM